MIWKRRVRARWKGLPAIVPSSPPSVGCPAIEAQMSPSEAADATAAEAPPFACPCPRPCCWPCPCRPATATHLNCTVTRINCTATHSNCTATHSNCTVTHTNSAQVLVRLKMLPWPGKVRDLVRTKRTNCTNLALLCLKLTYRGGLVHLVLPWGWYQMYQLIHCLK